MKKLIMLINISLVITAFCAAQTQMSENGGFRQEGVASWYGIEYQGRPTSSGELFDRNQYTAAHPTLPYGTVLTVTNLSNNNKQVQVRINDRGPQTEARIIDVSEAAAKELGMIEQGLARVVLELAPRGVELSTALTSTPSPAAATSPAVTTSPVATTRYQQQIPITQTQQNLQNTVQTSPAATAAATTGRTPNPTLPSVQPQPKTTTPARTTTSAQTTTPAQTTTSTRTTNPPATQAQAQARPSTTGSPVQLPAPAPAPSAQNPVTRSQTASDSASQVRTPNNSGTPAYTPQTPRIASTTTPLSRPNSATIAGTSPTQLQAVATANRQPVAIAPDLIMPPSAKVDPLAPTQSGSVPVEKQPVPVYAQAELLNGPLVAGKTYRLQVGSYNLGKNGLDAFDRVSKAGLRANWEPYHDQLKGDVYRVVITNVKAEDVSDLLVKLGNAGFDKVMAREE